MTYTNGSSRQSVTDACYTGSTYAASLTPGGAVFQWFATDGERYWGVNVQVYFGSSGGTSDDKVYVEVTNATFFGQSEQYTIRATDYGTCADVYIPLQRIYANSSVQVKVWRDYDSTMNGIAVDNISFWGGPYN